ncbi:MAG: hypBA [Chthonomonadaceae bacterium]|nr:hypBA [Chthonomonadaceae bacterium]
MTMTFSADAQNRNVSPKLNRVAETRFELHGVVGEYLDSVTRNWLLTMPDANPAVLEMFQDRDKVPHRDLLPWSGEFAGKYLTGAVQVLRLTHDPTLKTYLTHYVAKLISLQADDGYLGPFPADNRLEGKGGTWDVWGHYHVMLGLLLWHEETGDKAALDCAVKIGDLMCRKFLHTGKRVVDTGSAEMNLSAIHSLALLYEVTHTPSYLALARQILDEFQDKSAGDYLRVALAGKEYFEGPKPRWESLHAIMGMAELYFITGDADLRKAYEQIWWSTVKLDRHNNGGFSSGEQAQGDPYHPGAIETCCTVAWIALSVDMLRMTGSSLVADELELSTLNQALGYQHRSGATCSYDTPMNGVRRNSTDEIGFQIRPGSEQVNCCSANAPRGLGMISDWALMTDGSDSLTLNWYGPSTLTAQVNGKTVTLKQQTDYPRTGDILLHVSPENAQQFSLHLRIPHWSARTTVRVNGKPVANVQSGSYVTLNRTWKPGDVVRIGLDMSPHFWVGERECAGKTSIYRGPLLLVLETAKPALTYSPQWKSYGEILAVNTLPSSVETTFDGSSVVWTGNLFEDAGQARVTIDGQEVAIVDQYGPQRGIPFRWEKQGLTLGHHTIKITLLDTKNPASKDRWINVSSLGAPSGTEKTLDAGHLRSRLLPVGRTSPPQVSVEYTTTDGSRLRLRDYGTAGENGTPYVSWLNVRNVPPTPFTVSNPLRSGRPQPL